MSRSKKAKIDFASLVASSRSVLRSAQVLEEKAVDFKCTVAELLKDGIEMHRLLDRCGEEVLELILVTRLGIQGLDWLRSAIQLVPEAFLDDRATVVRSIVNEVLAGSKKDCITTEECQVLIAVCTQKFGTYMGRKSDPMAYGEELWKLTSETGRGYNAFVAPPVTHCINPACNQGKLSKRNDVTNVTVYDINGGRPASKLGLKCNECGTSYNYSMFGKKKTTGEKYYSCEREYVEASDVVLVDRHLHHLFASLKYVGYRIYSCFQLQVCLLCSGLMWLLGRLVLKVLIPPPPTHMRARASEL